MRLFKDFTRAEKGWMMYDWANSAHTIIIATILPIFYNTLMASSTQALARWGSATSAAMLVTAVLSPLLGALGDFKNWKKRLFTGFVILGAVSCAVLAATPWLGESMTVDRLGGVILALYILSTIGFAAANLYYDSFLPEVTTEERMDRVSIMAYGLGYFGGSTIPLVLFLVMMQLGIDTRLCMSVAFGLTAVWWIVFTIPMWRHVHQKHYVERRRGVIVEAVKNLLQTARRIFRNKPMLVYLLAYFFYIDGVGTIIRMSTMYGSALGIDETQMMLALLLVQLLGLPFALFYTRLARKFGARAMIGVGICIYSFICVFAFFISQTWHFWMLAVLVSTSQGGIQALSRSVFGKMIDEKERSGEYFGFFDIFGKFSTVMGPALLGGVSALAGNVIMRSRSIVESEASAETLAQISKEAAPYGVLSVLVIFVIGAALYFIVLPRVERKQ